MLKRSFAVFETSPLATVVVFPDSELVLRGLKRENVSIIKSH